MEIGKITARLRWLVDALIEDFDFLLFQIVILSIGSASNVSWCLETAFLVVVIIIVFFVILFGCYIRGVIMCWMTP